jgi:hypothetical protein
LGSTFENASFNFKILNLWLVENYVFGVIKEKVFSVLLGWRPTSGPPALAAGPSTPSPSLSRPRARSTDRGSMRSSRGRHSSSPVYGWRPYGPAPSALAFTHTTCSLRFPSPHSLSPRPRSPHQRRQQRHHAIAAAAGPHHRGSSIQSCSH